MLPIARTLLLLLLTIHQSTIVLSALLPCYPCDTTAVTKRVEQQMLRLNEKPPLRQQGVATKNNEDTGKEYGTNEPPAKALWDRFSALTLAAVDMEESRSFYQKLGLSVSYQSDDFCTLQYPPNTLPHTASIYVNLELNPDYAAGSSWGRIVIYVTDVDAMYEIVTKQGFVPEFSPRNASWGERYFHVKDPSGHELSFAKPISFETNRYNK